MVRNQQAWVIGRHEETPKTSFGGAVCISMIALGAFWVFFGAVIMESGALRSAAYGAYWAGWNVMWGVGALLGRRRNYTIISYVEPPRKDPPKADVSTMVS